MMRNFYQTSAGRPYQYGTPGLSPSTPTTAATTNNVNSNQIRYPTSAVPYSQFSPLAAAGIRQVRKHIFSRRNIPSKSYFFLRTIHCHFKIAIGITKVYHHFESIIHQCFIIRHEQCVRVCLRVLPFWQWRYSLRVYVCAILFDEIKKEN